MRALRGGSFNEERFFTVKINEILRLFSAETARGYESLKAKRRIVIEKYCNRAF